MQTEQNLVLSEFHYEFQSLFFNVPSYDILTQFINGTTFRLRLSEYFVKLELQSLPFPYSRTKSWTDKWWLYVYNTLYMCVCLGGVVPEHCERAVASICWGYGSSIHYSITYNHFTCSNQYCIGLVQSSQGRPWSSSMWYWLYIYLDNVLLHSILISLSLSHDNGLLHSILISLSLSLICLGQKCLTQSGKKNLLHVLSVRYKNSWCTKEAKATIQYNNKQGCICCLSRC